MQLCGRDQPYGLPSAPGIADDDKLTDALGFSSGAPIGREDNRAQPDFKTQPILSPQGNHRRCRADRRRGSRSTRYQADALPRRGELGDLQIENFGTWRDREGRLIWGLKDFDETYTLHYTNNLVRLARSAHLAIVVGHLSLKASEASKAILAGYTDGLQAATEDWNVWRRDDAS